MTSASTAPCDRPPGHARGRSSVPGRVGRQPCPRRSAAGLATCAVALVSSPSCRSRRRGRGARSRAAAVPRRAAGARRARVGGSPGGLGGPCEARRARPPRPDPGGDGRRPGRGVHGARAAAPTTPGARATSSSCWRRSTARTTRTSRCRCVRTTRARAMRRVDVPRAGAVGRRTRRGSSRRPTPRSA